MRLAVIAAWAGEEAGGLAGQVGFDPLVFGLQLAGFVALLIFLQRLFWRRVFDHLRAREDSIRTVIEQAERRQREVEQLAAEHRRRLEEFEREAQARMNEEVRKAQAERARILAEAHEARMAELEKAKAEIRIERDKALVELRRHMVDLTLRATQRVLGDAVTPQVQESLVRRYLQELERV